MSHQKFPTKPNAMKSLNILIFNWRCWLNPEMGGAEVFTYENAKRWVKAGHAVTLWASEFPRIHPYSCYLIYKESSSPTMLAPSLMLTLFPTETDLVMP